MRGGCWNDNNSAGYAVCCRSAYRSGSVFDYTYPSYAYYCWGFRVACFPAE